MTHRCEMEPPHFPGGGWRLRFFEQSLDGSEIERGGDVFPPEAEISEEDVYADALQTGENWLAAHSEREA